MAAAPSPLSDSIHRYEQSISHLRGASSRYLLDVDLVDKDQNF